MLIVAVIESGNVKFLHIADVHLGCTRYQLAESPRDFFDAWMDVLHRYAICEQRTMDDGQWKMESGSELSTVNYPLSTKVDFVIICGDFFHKKAVPPETMNYAVEGLNLLNEHGIPVVMIEGNHDQHYNDSKYSWLRSLADWNLIYLLEPGKSEDGKITYESWNADTKRGGFIDIGRARIFGSHWYGASGNWAIPMLTEAIRSNHRDGAFHILMLHTDVEGHQTHPIPALSLDALKQLKAGTDYVGLGHTHMHYEIDNWAFNPGSIEVTNISEFRETRGAFIVTVGDDNSVSAKHVTQYHHRPFQRLTFDVTPYSDAKDITAAVLDTVTREARVAETTQSADHPADEASAPLLKPVGEQNPATPPKTGGELLMPAPIIEITLRGQLGFPNSLIEMQKIRDESQKITGALHVRIKNHSIPVEMGDVAEIDEDEGREKVERRVVDLIVAKDKRFKANAAAISDAVVGAKRMALSDDEPEKIVEFIAAKAANV